MSKSQVSRDEFNRRAAVELEHRPGSIVKCDERLQPIETDRGEVRQALAELDGAISEAYMDLVELVGMITSILNTSCKVAQNDIAPPRQQRVTSLGIKIEELIDRARTISVMAKGTSRLVDL